jgi:hypothetical protein
MASLCLKVYVRVRFSAIRAPGGYRQTRPGCRSGLWPRYCAATSGSLSQVYQRPELKAPDGSGIVRTEWFTAMNVDITQELERLIQSKVQSGAIPLPAKWSARRCAFLIKETRCLRSGATRFESRSRKAGRRPDAENLPTAMKYSTGSTGRWRPWNVPVLSEAVRSVATGRTGPRPNQDLSDLGGRPGSRSPRVERNPAGSAPPGRQAR